MRELQLVLDDDALYEAIQTEATATGHTMQEVVVQALRQWRDEVELHAAERNEIGGGSPGVAEEGGRGRPCLLRAAA